ncbi:hypothetical protein CVT24_007735 [Panaeolus cyanescens]|uniref:Sugar phosphate transporter domain-containing protein n=1 Tax=Panaeolus cyanescens TaxID=181874 RepID=A0A409YKQ0_9AGAR|nr:hypothetical protein CVT24_007735 [Panaeolus cyanescens]
MSTVLPIQLSINLKAKDHDHPNDIELGVSNITVPHNVPSLCGIPLKYLSLVTLAVQNSALTLVMHYSRISTPADRAYSAATAVLMNEILKGTISMIIAFCRIEPTPYDIPHRQSILDRTTFKLQRLWRDIMSPDCWKLSIPAILYVIQNNLQYIAASNLDAATFQVTYQMKILTTAAFSVLLLRKKLSSIQWLSLIFLAIGVAVVQIQAGAGGHNSASAVIHAMKPMKGFLAVTFACFTSGLAGVYFEMVLKNSQTDLWVRNVQLSLFSLLPALAPIIVTQQIASNAGEGLMSVLFANFGAWAWATVLVQVLGGLVTAMVIKYSDNILKGFATSLSIVISFLASVALFDFHLTITFVLGSSIVLIATWLYNQNPSSARATLSINKDWMLWSKSEKQQRDPLRSPPPIGPQFGTLSAISSTTSLSSLASISSLSASVSHSDTEARPFLR